MELLSLIYNFFLTALFMVPLTLAFLCYRVCRKQVYLFTSLLFLLDILTNMLVCMYESVSAFYNFYISTFMTVPSIRTVLFVGYLFCLIQISIAILDEKHKMLFYGILVALLCYMMFIPMLQNGMLKLFLYYTPVQIFTFSLSVYGLVRFPKVANDYSDREHKIFRQFFFCTAIFSVLIILEDYIFMFHIDEYAENGTSSIVMRSTSDDLMHICHAILMITLLFPMLQSKLAELSRISDVDTAIATEQPLPTEHEPPKTLNEMEESLNKKAAEQQQGSTAPIKDNSKFYFFCKKYLLTTREQDILRLLLENKDNMEICDELYISIGTTKTHVHNIFVKLDIKKRRELMELYQDFKELEE